MCSVAICYVIYLPLILCPFLFRSAPSIDNVTIHAVEWPWSLGSLLTPLLLLLLLVNWLPKLALEKYILSWFQMHPSIAQFLTQFCWTHSFALSFILITSQNGNSRLDPSLASNTFALSHTSEWVTYFTLSHVLKLDSWQYNIAAS